MANSQDEDKGFEPSDKAPKARQVRISDGKGGSYLGGLPPITDIVIPSHTTKSGTIRWLHELGYEVKEIYVFLGIKYQMVRNIITTKPKRAAREDLAPLLVEYKPENDPMQDAMDGALDESLMAARRERNKARLESLRQNPDTPLEDAE